jgi:hypothetical protein
MMLLVNFQLQKKSKNCLSEEGKMETKKSLEEYNNLKNLITENGEHMKFFIEMYQKYQAENCYENIDFIKESKISSNLLLTDEMKYDLIQSCEHYLKQCPRKFIPHFLLDKKIQLREKNRKK